MSGSEIFSIDGSSFFDGISLKERNSYNKTVSFDQDLVESLEKEPEDLSTWTLFKQIRFLSDNKLRSGIFEVELYKRLIHCYPYCYDLACNVIHLWIFKGCNLG